MVGNTGETDAVSVLAGDHRQLRLLFEEFEELPPTAYVRKSKVVARIIDLITVHAFVAREVLYPRLSALMPEVEAELATLRHQHRKAETIAVELWTMRPEDPRFAPRMSALIEELRDHLDVQEDDWLPRILEQVDPATRHALGAELIKARRRAPGSPRLGS